jgi:hypothetical protein
MWLWLGWVKLGWIERVSKLREGKKVYLLRKRARTRTKEEARGKECDPSLAECQSI